MSSKQNTLGYKLKVLKEKYDPYVKSIAVGASIGITIGITIAVKDRLDVASRFQHDIDILHKVSTHHNEALVDIASVLEHHGLIDSLTFDKLV